jgi:hypothetical protein
VNEQRKHKKLIDEHDPSVPSDDDAPGAAL